MINYDKTVSTTLFQPKSECTLFERVFERVYSWSFTVVKLFTSRKVRTKINTQYKKQYLNTNIISVLTNSFQELWILSHFQSSANFETSGIRPFSQLWTDNYVTTLLVKPITNEWCMQYLDCVTDSMFKRTKITALKQQVF